MGGWGFATWDSGPNMVFFMSLPLGTEEEKIPNTNPDKNAK